MKPTSTKALAMITALALLLSVFCNVFAIEPEANPTNINISANYSKIGEESGKNVYRIDISSLDDLSPISSISFSVKFADGMEIQRAAFPEELQNGDYSVSNVGKTVSNFSNGAGATAVSGKVTFCSIEVLSESVPSTENTTFENLTAKDAELTEITFNPILSVAEGPVVPELSEDERKIYDAILSLPKADALSFYDSENNIIDILALSEQVYSVSEDYNKLDSDQKDKIQAVLKYNGKNSDSLSTLPPIIEGMLNTYDIIYMYKLVSVATDSNCIDFRFITNVCSEIISGISSAGLPTGSTVLSQFSTAKSSLGSKKTLFDAKYASAPYDKKISSIENQLDKIQKLSEDTYYNKYLDDIYKQANALYKDIEDNYKESYKEYILTDLKKTISKIEAIRSGVSDIPEYTISAIHPGFNFTVSVTRKKAIDLDALIKLVVYNSDDLKTPIDEFEKEFPKTAKTLEFKKAASKSIYRANKNVTICVYYIVSGAELLIGSDEYKVTSVARADQTGSGSIGIPSTSKQPEEDDSDDVSEGGGTVYPTPGDDDEDKPKPVEEKPLFSDIDNYGWAKEAIEGLYYAGIVNGMEEGIFNPSGNVTREQFCKMVVQLFGVLQYDKFSTFNDVKEDAWYFPYINSAIKAGYVQGQSNEFFGIGQNIMRQDMATILYRALGSDNANAVELAFVDNDSIAGYAKDAVASLVGLGAINGYEDNTFKPRGTATRAEAAKVIWEIYKTMQ